MDEAVAARDAKLVERAVSGEADAFESLVRAHADAVYGHALRFFGEPATAQDAAQEVFLKVYRSLGDFDGHAAFSTWLYRITRNVCLDLMRSGRHQAVPLDPVDLPEPSEADFADGVATSVDLEHAMRTLAPEERDAFDAIALFDLSYEQAGEVLGVPAGTVKSRVFRARRTLVTVLGLVPRGGV